MFQQVYQGTTLKGHWVIRKSGGRVSVTTNTASGVVPIILVGTTPCGCTLFFFTIIFYHIIFDSIDCDEYYR